MRLDGNSRTQDSDPTGPEAGNLFDIILRVAQKQGGDDKPDYRMATVNGGVKTGHGAEEKSATMAPA